MVNRGGTGGRAAAVYARISSDVQGQGLGVARQEEDCRRLAEQLGWAIADVYVDNDLSAFSGKRRPAYERMLLDLAEGRRDAVICYHLDRLTRRPIELEQFVTTLDTAGVRQVRFVTGDADLGTGDGLLVGRIMAAVAANESAAKSRRVKRKLEQNAQAGLPHGGFRRPFGFEDDKVTIRPDEAAVIQAVVTRYLAGESLRSLCVWLDDSGVRTVGGGVWRSPTLRGLLRSGRIAGLREQRGEVVGPAVWSAIITPTERDRVLARMSEQTTTGRRTPRSYLLSGLLRCGRCGGKLFSSPRANYRRYVCLSGPDHGGCGRLTVVAEPVEELIAEAVLFRLDTPELAERMSGSASGDSYAAGLAEGLAADQGQLDELAVMYGKQEISAREWRAAREPVEQRMKDRRRQLAAATQTDALAGLPGQGAQLREDWAGLTLTRQAAIIRAVLDHAVVLPGLAGARELDPARVRPEWRP
jgi:DNA invertase Pin-like site-specific DNA recombinase